jgi:hypothetical protein
MSGAVHVKHVNHGNSVAAWTAVAIVMIASAVSAVGVLVSKPWLFWVGIALIAVGVASGKLLQMMGFGIPRETEDASSLT